MSSVVGFDLGNESCVVAVAQHRGIDVVLNDESKRETPAVVSFGDKQRFIGTAGAASATSNPNNTVSQIKRLLGRPFSDPDLQRDIQSLPFRVTEAPDGFPLVHVRYLGKEEAFTPTQLLAMVLSNLKSIAQKNLNLAVNDCCIGIPAYFTDTQRRAVMDAATIAGLHPLRLFHETTATALGYGIYKTDLPDCNPINVVFVDVGHSSMQVSIAAIKKGQLKILAHSYDRSLGGRDFDEALYKHFAEKFKEEYQIDVYANARACLRLRSACDKLKRVLSANSEAPLNIECLMDDKDVKGLIKRDEFEQISGPILDRVKGPLERVLCDANLSVGDIHSVEMVGSGSRIPAIIRILTEFFNVEPRRTMNASECVARGCALQCAILSPTFMVREFEVLESYPFTIVLSCKGHVHEKHNGGNVNQSTIVFPKGSPVPSTEFVPFSRPNTFSVDVVYYNGTSGKISTHMIGPFQSSEGELAHLSVMVHLNLHGIVCVETATLLEEEEIVVPVTAIKESPKDSTTVDTDEVKSSYISEGDMNKPDAKSPTNGTCSGIENGEQQPDESTIQMETNNKVESTKKTVKRTIVPIQGLVYGEMLSADLQEAVERERVMALQDRVMEETKDLKNAVEAYVYDMRKKLNDRYMEFVTELEKEQFMVKLQQVEDWLYEDGEDETEEVYVATLKGLKKQGDPIEYRYKESTTEHGRAIDQLLTCINHFMEVATSKHPRFGRIGLAEKQEIIGYCKEANSWLAGKMEQQDVLPKHATPVLHSAGLKIVSEELRTLCVQALRRKAKSPAKFQTPSPPESPEPQPQAAEQQTAVSGEIREQEPESNRKVLDDEPEPMDTDKSESGTDAAA